MTSNSKSRIVKCLQSFWVPTWGNIHMNLLFGWRSEFASRQTIHFTLQHIFHSYKLCLKSSFREQEEWVSFWIYKNSYWSSTVAERQCVFCSKIKHWISDQSPNLDQIVPESIFLAYYRLFSQRFNYWLTLYIHAYRVLLGTQEAAPTFHSNKVIFNSR